ncbi:MAG TPA: hypothetical protein VL242_01370 [Sorangium sp.]|nr:hypothetical protein [Sorangium sp.]
MFSFVARHREMLRNVAAILVEQQSDGTRAVPAALLLHERAELRCLTVLAGRQQADRPSV